LTLIDPAFYETFCVYYRRPVSATGVNKVDMSDDNEPSLSKVDVVLTFAVEVLYGFDYSCIDRLDLLFVN
jgi:hypothetical protein